MFAPWGEFVSDGAAPGHGVEVYARDEELVDTVATFVAAGVAADASAVLVATPAHVAAIVEALERRGLVDPPLIVADAEQTLERILEAGLEPEPFSEIVGELLDAAEATALGAPRAFGEMVDLLVQRHAIDEAIALEELWEELRRARPFSLLCAYRLDVFDEDAQRAPLPAICNVHSHVLPAHDPSRFDAAVRKALTEVLGPATTRDIYYIVDRPLRARRVPIAQDALRWLAASFPDTAGQVLEAARGYYAAVEAA